MSERSFIRFCSVSDIVEAESKCCEVEGLSALISNTNKGFYAVENKCLHQTAELIAGKASNCVIFSPLHGQRFDLRDGVPIEKLTDKPIRNFALKIEADKLLVNPDLAAAQD